MPLLPLFDAAQALGVSPATLRKRLKAGTAQGERRQTRSGFAWWVEVDNVPAPEGTQVGAQPGRDIAEMATQVGDQVGDQQVPTDYLALQEAVSRLEAHNADLRDTNAHLTDELTARRREVQELHVLLGRMQASLPAPAPTPAGRADDASVEWKLEPAGPAEPDTEHAPSAGESTGRRGWWTRLVTWMGGA